MKKHLLVLSALLISFGALAKLPAPSEEAKMKASEVAEKNAHGAKVAGYKLCLAQNKAAAHYFKSQGNAKASAVTTPACVDPGAYKPSSPSAALPASPAAAKAKKG